VFQNIDSLLYGFSSFVFLKICFLFIVSCFLIIIFSYDLKHYIIPDRVVFPAVLVVAIWHVVSWLFFDSYTKYNMLNAIYSAIGASLFFLLIVLVSKGEWMGMGDVKLSFFMGLFLGFPKILIALFLAFFIGALVGIVLIASGRKGLKSEIPFGPFLVTATFSALFFENQIIDFYLSLIQV
jgi:leader peptidase (prepilin peptidase)/N-methyltransferase